VAWHKNVALLVTIVSLAEGVAAESEQDCRTALDEGRRVGWSTHSWRGRREGRLGVGGVGSRATLTKRP